MYDPDRAQAVTNNGRISSWVAAQAALAGAREGAAIKNGDGFRILTETVTSPTLTAQIKALLKDTARREVASVRSPADATTPISERCSRSDVRSTRFTTSIRPT